MTMPCARLIVGCAVLYLTLTTPCVGLIIRCVVLYQTLTTPFVGLIVPQLYCSATWRFHFASNLATAVRQAGNPDSFGYF